MPKIRESRWLAESSDLPYGSVKIKSLLGIKKQLYSGRSLFQKIEVYETQSFGRVLVLDGIFQTSEKDGFIYHEMLCQLPLFCHRHPKKVLIIGGGDGGSLREILKHPIDKVWLVEIDKKVIEISKKYLPSISRRSFDSKKAEIIIGNGLKFIKKYKNFFDVIILDSSDPSGPARKLFSSEFYKDVKRALKKNGVISVQSGSLTVQPKLVSLINQRLKKIFSFVQTHFACVPLYQAGEYAFILASDNNLNKISSAVLKKRFSKLSLKTKYYSPEIHFSSKVLPKIFKEIVS